MESASSEADRTRWSLIQRLADCHPAAITEFVVLYQPIAIRILAKKGLARVAPDDVWSEFIHRLLNSDGQKLSKVLERQKEQDADGAKRSSFRGWLVRSVIRLAWRMEAGKKMDAVGTGDVATDDDLFDAVPDAAAEEDVVEFDSLWVWCVLQDSLSRLRQRCLEKPQHHIRWDLFARWHLQPYRDQQSLPQIPSYDEMASEFKIEVKDVREGLRAARKWFGECLSEVLRAFCANEDAPEVAGLASLQDILSRTRLISPQKVLLSGSTIPPQPLALDEFSHGTECARALIGLASLDPSQLSPYELHDIWLMLTKTPLQDVLTPEEAVQARAIVWDEPIKTPVTAGQFLSAQRPPQDLLDIVRRRAKHALKRQDKTWPEAIWWTLHYACIALARRTHGTTLTDKSNADVKEGLKMVLRYSWLTPEIRSLLEDAKSQL
ncbi:MAG: hypothetical protein ACKV2Q_00695 [Planctomycetaceae bacterium]